jgi:outer membrane receptor protein involved in Fe transport
MQEADFTSLRILTLGAGGSVSRPGIQPNADDLTTMTHELRLRGKAFGDRLDWLIGGFYSREDIDSLTSTTAGTDYQRAVSAGNFGAAAGVNPLFTLTAFGNGGVPVNLAGAFTENSFAQRATSVSLFTHHVFDITDRLQLSVGARYIHEKKRANFDQLGALNPACQASVNGVLSGAVPAALRAGLVGLNCFSFITPVTITAPAALGGGLASRFLPLPSEWSGQFKDNALTYTAQLAYKPAPDWLIYGGFSRGFKSGGFNLDPTAAILVNSTSVLTTGASPVFADPRFKSEKVDSYELGVKGRVADIYGSLTLFQMDLKDFQVLEFTGIQFATFNVDKARARGAELELFGKLTDHISLNAAATYVKARYADACAENAPLAVQQSVVRLCGLPLTNAPKFSSVVGLTYDGPLARSRWGLLANVNVAYSSKRRTGTQALETNLTLLPFDYQRAYAKLNARIGIKTPDDRFSLELWGTNLTNKITRSLTVNTPLRGGLGTRSRIGFVEEPRMYGVTGRAKF